jgi:hypothetical protein
MAFRALTRRTFTVELGDVLTRRILNRESSGSMKCWGILVAAQLAASQEGVDSMEFV